MSNKQEYQAVIGLEIHLQLSTKSKMFSSVDNEIWQAEPNTHVSPVELGLPGALPVPNQEAIRRTHLLGVALGCTINTNSKFDRKNYFYPDLPKGYQISQYDQPFCENGALEIEIPSSKEKKIIRIRRIHLEEDTGKSQHKGGQTYLDFNKSGVPLVELVTEPDFHTAEEASEFAKMIQEVARRLQISPVDMEKGNMRLEANISVRPIGTNELPNYRVEVKNINSFKFMRDAIEYEILRQKQALEQDETLEQETRGWDRQKGQTYIQRKKEDAHDYRYFPEPDIPPLTFTQEYIQQIIEELPPLPWKIKADLQEKGVRAEFAHSLAYDTEKYHWFIEKQQTEGITIEELAKFVVNATTLEAVKSSIENHLKKQTAPQLAEEELDTAIESSIAENPQAVADFANGNENAVQFLFGQVMKKTKGQASPQITIPLIRKKLLSE